MKILVVVPYFEEPHRWMISGQKTARELARTHDVIVLTTGQNSTIEKVHEHLTIYRLKDIFLRDPINYSFVPKLWPAIWRLVQEEKPDAYLINKHMFFTSLAIWPLKWLKKRVIVQTDTFPGVNWFPKNRLVGWVMWLYARLIGNPILKAADKVILLHEGLIPDAQKLGLTYEVIHNGIDLESFDRAVVPQDLKKKKGEIWVGYVGRLESVKGWYDLASVALTLVQQNPRLHFFFVGPTHHAQEAIAPFQHPQIHFLGLRHDIAGLDKLLDIFVLPSLSEGLSNALMEAMAAGCCCVASNVGGNAILIEDGKTGLLVPPTDRSDLCQKLTWLITHPEQFQRLGRAARQRIEADYDLQKNVRRLARRLV